MLGHGLVNFFVHIFLRGLKAVRTRAPAVIGWCSSLGRIMNDALATVTFVNPLVVVVDVIKLQDRFLITGENNLNIASAGALVRVTLATMRDVAAEPQRHGNHAIASGEKLTFSSDAFSGSFFPLGNDRP